jgi:Icc-related predicted phosphoesterase
MLIAALSDLHGHKHQQLPPIPPADVLLIPGDICASYGVDDPDRRVWQNAVWQRKWMVERFIPWVDTLPVERVIVTWGNHDFIGERPGKTPRYGKVHPPTHPKLVILQDSGHTFGGLKFWGSPWALNCGPWVFTGTEEKLREKYALIPSDTDVLLSHGPPFGFGDGVPLKPHEPFYPGLQQVGSHALMDRVREIKPQILLCGHIHEARGEWEEDGIIYANVSHMNSGWPPMTWQLSPRSS